MEAATNEELPLFPQEEWYEQLLRYGLYIGAAFQIVCILAIIFDVNPSKQSELCNDDSSSDDDSEDEDEVDVTSQRNRRRLERKKRR